MIDDLTKTCQTCGGHGRKYAMVGNYRTDWTIRCPTCNGNGYIIEHNPNLVKLNPRRR